MYLLGSPQTFDEPKAYHIARLLVMDVIEDEIREPAGARPSNLTHS